MFDMRSGVDALMAALREINPRPTIDGVGGIVILVQASEEGSEGQCLYDSNIKKTALPLILRDLADAIEVQVGGRPS